jgi:uncharacterized protein with HEPN domain
MKKEPIVFIKHINDEINKILESVKGITKEKFIENELLRDASVRRIEIIGEAVKNIPDSFRRKYPKIEWQGISGIRDKLIHYYFGVDFNVVWRVIEKDIPKLKLEINSLLKKEVLNKQ